MTETECAKAMAELDQRSKSNTRRIEKLEIDHDALSQMAKQVAVMAENNKNFQSRTNEKLEEISDKQDKIGKKVEAIENVPGEKWKKLTWIIITAIASGVIGMLLAQLFK